MGEEDDVAVRILDAELAHPVELILHGHDDPGAAFNAFEEAVDAIVARLRFNREEERVGTADRALRQPRDVFRDAVDDVQEDVHAIALQPDEHERRLLRHGGDDLEPEHVAIESCAPVDVGHDQVGSDVLEFHRVVS